MEVDTRITIYMGWHPFFFWPEPRLEARDQLDSQLEATGCQIWDRWEGGIPCKHIPGSNEWHILTTTPPFARRHLRNFIKHFRTPPPSGRTFKENFGAKGAEKIEILSTKKTRKIGFRYTLGLENAQKHALQVKVFGVPFLVSSFSGDFWSFGNFGCLMTPPVWR